MTVRIALIGCGFFARNHMHAWRDLPGAEVVAVCDLDPAKAESFAAEFGASPFTDAAAMLADVRPDVADIATTVASHRPLVELASRQAGAVICQKPFAATLDDGTAMVAACAEGGGAALRARELPLAEALARDRGAGRCGPDRHSALPSAFVPARPRHLREPALSRRRARPRADRCRASPLRHGSQPHGRGRTDLVRDAAAQPARQGAGRVPGGAASRVRGGHERGVQLPHAAFARSVPADSRSDRRGSGTIELLQGHRLRHHGEAARARRMPNPRSPPGARNRGI
jgi:hypothetical protein